MFCVDWELTTNSVWYAIVSTIFILQNQCGKQIFSNLFFMSFSFPFLSGLSYLNLNELDVLQMTRVSSQQPAGAFIFCTINFNCESGWGSVFGGGFECVCVWYPGTWNPVGAITLSSGYAYCSAPHPQHIRIKRNLPTEYSHYFTDAPCKSFLMPYFTFHRSHKHKIYNAIMTNGKVTYGFTLRMRHYNNTQHIPIMLTWTGTEHVLCVGWNGEYLKTTFNKYANIIIRLYQIFQDVPFSCRCGRGFICM